jgi:hypothetical protein
MVKQVLLFAILILLSSCVSLNYRFIEKIEDSKRPEFVKRINNSEIQKNGILSGIYTEKKISYKFMLKYDLEKDIFSLKFTNILNDENIFEARIQNGEKYYDYFTNSIFSVKIGLILERFRQIITIFPETYNLFVTSDDYLVMVDNEKNYQKYNNNFRIIKKENDKFTIRYIYSEKDEKLARIEFKENLNSFLLVLDKN